MVEGKIPLIIEDSGIVQGRAVIEFIEGHDVVCIGIGQCQMSYEPASTVAVRKAPCDMVAIWFLHESSPSSDHNILDIGQWLELRAPNQDWGLFPYAEVFEEFVVFYSILN
jgi:hypothetical protein